MELVVALAVALLAVPSVAQPSASTPISGVVVDADTRAPIPNATVSAGAARVSADAAGRFTLLVEGGRVTLLVEASGYFALTTTLEIPEAGLSGRRTGARPRDTVRDLGRSDSIGARRRPPPKWCCPSRCSYARRPRQRLSHAADLARRGGDRGVWQPARGPRRLGRSEPDRDGRRRNSRSVSAVRADQRLQSRNDSALRIGDWRLQRQVRRPPLVAAGGREPRGFANGGAHRLGFSQHHRRERRVRRKVAGRRGRIVAGDRPPYVLRPGGGTHRRSTVPRLRRSAGQSGVGTGRQPHGLVPRLAQPTGGRCRDR